MYVDLDELTELENDSIFTLIRVPDRSYEKDYHAWFDLNIEMNMDMLSHKRQGYYIFDLISDVGGIQSILFSTFAFFVSVWNYNMLENSMVSRLYKLERKDENSRHVKDTFRESDFMKSRRFYNPKEFLEIYFLNGPVSAEPAKLIDWKRASNKHVCVWKMKQISLK